MKNINLPKRTFLRRLTVLTGGALLGATAALTLAAPASAHHSDVSGKYVCDQKTSEWVVTWTVDSYAPAGVNHYKLLKADLTPAGSTVTQIVRTTDDSYPYEVGKPVVGEQRLPATARSATLTVHAKWENGFEEDRDRTATVTLKGKCGEKPEQPKPTVSFSDTCDGSTVTIVNPDAKHPADFVVTGENGFSQKVTVKPGASGTVAVPAESAGAIVVKEVTKHGDKTIGEHARKTVEDCGPAPEVKVASRSDCDSLTVSVENPKDSPAAIEGSATDGKRAVKFTVAPGETEQVKFDAEQGTEVTVTIGKESLPAIAWKQPASRNTGGGGGSGPSLPVTGASVGGAVAVAVVLLAAGTGLFFAFRRRRIRFTA